MSFFNCVRFWGFASLLVTIYAACGGGDEFNLWQPIAEDSALKSDDVAILEEAKILMDDGEYKDASDLLQPVIDDSGRDSNTARSMYAAAKLGEANLDIWSIIKKILDAIEDGDTFSGGLDDILNAFDETFLGTGTKRDKRVVALATALSTMLAVPDKTDNKALNTGCLFAGMLSVPTQSDATEAITLINTALSNIKDSATNGGQDCPDISQLDEGQALLATVSQYFTMILQAAAQCPMLNLDDLTSEMNEVESALGQLTSQADKGCDTVPTCPDAIPDCQSLFPTCVQETLEVGTSSAEAGDDQIDSCEIILHCLDSTSCFE